MPRNMELHDHFPKQTYNRMLLHLWEAFIILLFGTVFFILLVDFEYLWMEVLTWIFLILFVLISIALPIIISLTKVLTLYDDFDYSNVAKTDFDFTSSFGLKHSAYFYSRKDVDIDADTTPRPTIIGFHGWGSHHREMDRFVLPTIIEEGYLYFIYDSRGRGLTKGNKNQMEMFEESKEFIAKLKSLPYVDKKRIAVIGMSMGAAKAALAAYPDPDIKLLLTMSGPYDLKYSKEHMSFFDKFFFLLSGFRWNATEQEFKKYSAINVFKKEGIILNGNSKPTPNNDRVLLIADADDGLVRPENTIHAKEVLNLSDKNCIIFPRGGHSHQGNEYNLAVAIYKFLKERL
jgi:dienelactone hydrolase